MKNWILRSCLGIVIAASVFVIVDSEVLCASAAAQTCSPNGKIIDTSGGVRTSETTFTLGYVLGELEAKGKIAEIGAKLTVEVSYTFKDVQQETTVTCQCGEANDGGTCCPTDITGTFSFEESVQIDIGTKLGLDIIKIPLHSSFESSASPLQISEGTTAGGSVGFCTATRTFTTRETSGSTKVELVGSVDPQLLGVDISFDHDVQTLGFQFSSQCYCSADRSVGTVCDNRELPTISAQNMVVNGDDILPKRFRVTLLDPSRSSSSGSTTGAHPEDSILDITRVTWLPIAIGHSSGVTIDILENSQQRISQNEISVDVEIKLPGCSGIPVRDCSIAESFRVEAPINAVISERDGCTRNSVAQRPEIIFSLAQIDASPPMISLGSVSAFNSPGSDLIARFGFSVQDEDIPTNAESFIMRVSTSPQYDVSFSSCGGVSGRVTTCQQLVFNTFGTSINGPLIELSKPLNDATQGFIEPTPGEAITITLTVTDTFGLTDQETFFYEIGSSNVNENFVEAILDTRIFFEGDEVVIEPLTNDRGSDLAIGAFSASPTSVSPIADPGGFTLSEGVVENTLFFIAPDLDQSIWDQVDDVGGTQGAILIEFAYTAAKLSESGAVLGQDTSGLIRIQLKRRNNPPSFSGAQSRTIKSPESQLVEPIRIELASFISDPDGDEIELLSVRNTAALTQSPELSGTELLYYPEPNSEYTDEITIEICDIPQFFGLKGCIEGKLVINVLLDDSPTAHDDEVSIDEDSGSITIDVLANDTDPLERELSITENSNASNGTSNCDDAICTYTPNVDFFGTDSFSYTISNGENGTASANVTITINAVNDPPIAVSDILIAYEGESGRKNVIANDRDPDGDLIELQSIVFGSSNGAVSIDRSLVIYTPNSGFSGTDRAEYQVCEVLTPERLCATGVVNVTVFANSAPIALNDSASTDQDQGVDILVLQNDSDPDGDSFFITSFTLPANGSVDQRIIGNPFSSTTIGLHYQPNAGFFGTDTFNYTIGDVGGKSSSAIVTVQVRPSLQPPSAQDDFVFTDEDSSISISVLSNDTDPNNDALSITSVSSPFNGTAVILGSQIRYTPNANFNGSDQFSYTISDGAGGTDSANVSVTVNPVNDPPIAVDNTLLVNEDRGQVPIFVLLNDSDPDGDILRVIGISTPSNGSASHNTERVFYQPDANYNGSDFFTYTIEDAFGATATANILVTVTPANDQPMANNDSAFTDENVSVLINVLANDTDVDNQALSIQSVGSPSNGTAVISGNQIRYTPNANFSGSDSFSYAMTDGAGGSDSASVSVTVIEVNSAPNAVSDSASTNEDTSTTISVLSNDTDPENDPLTLQSVSNPPNGTASVLGNQVQYTPDANFNGSDSFTYVVSDTGGKTATGSVSVNVVSVNDLPVAVPDFATTNEDITVTVDVTANDSDADGDSLTVTNVSGASNGTASVIGNQVRYVPDPGFSGSETLTYTISDGNGGTDSASLSITINMVNDPPVANNDSASTNEDTSTTISVLSNDTDGDGDTLSIQSVSNPPNGTASILGNQVQYTPDANFNGNDSFTYTASDGNGGTDSATVNVTVNSVNDPPVANPDSGSTSEDSSVGINVISNDTDADGDSLTVSGNTQGSNGSVVCAGTSCTYTPAANFNGSDSFSYTASDGNGGSDTATVSVTVSAVNDSPTAVGDSATTQESQQVTISVLNNDSDPDGDSLTLQSVGSASNGIASKVGNVVSYTPNGGFTGTDNFSYTVSDGNGGTDTANVSVTVTPSNSPPNAVNDSATVNEDSSGNSINVLSNDSDPDAGDTISITTWTQGTRGSVSCAGNNCTYSTTTTNYNGSDSFTYTIGDGNGGSDTATVNVTISPVNDPPTASSDFGSTNEDFSTDIFVLLDDNDVDGDSLTIASVSNPPNGSTTNFGSFIRYTPDANFNGSDSFSYTVSDGNGGTDSASVSVTVFAQNDAPDAQNDVEIVLENSSSNTFNVRSNDTDIDGDFITISFWTSASKGSVFCTSVQCSYTPFANQTGSDSFGYTISDGNGGTDTANVFITILEVNNPPIANNDSTFTDENRSVAIFVLTNDSDPDNDPLSIISTSPPSNGVVQISGGTHIIYVPNTDFVGNDSFTYTISDGNGGFDSANVSVAVVGVLLLSNDLQSKSWERDRLQVTALADHVTKSWAIQPRRGLLTRFRVNVSSKNIE